MEKIVIHKTEIQSRKWCERKKIHKINYLNSRISNEHDDDEKLCGICKRISSSLFTGFFSHFFNLNFLDALPDSKWYLDDLYLMCVIFSFIYGSPPTTRTPPKNKRKPGSIPIWDRSYVNYKKRMMFGGKPVDSCVTSLIYFQLDGGQMYKRIEYLNLSFIHVRRKLCAQIT